MLCRLCHASEQFIQAHAIPKAFFCSLPSTGNLTLYSGSEFQKRSKIGVYDKQILCEDCEKKFGTVDNYGVQVLLTKFDTLFKDHQALEIDQNLLLQFLIATLWRASVSTHSFYQRINLGMYEEKASQVILNPNEPISPVFGVVLSCWEETGSVPLIAKTIMDPYRTKIDGINIYNLLLGKVTAHIKVDSQPFRWPLSECALLAQKSVTIIARPATGSSDHQAMIHTAKLSLVHNERKQTNR